MSNASNVQDLFAKLTGAGLPTAGAQGVIANVLAESGGNPAAVGDNGTSRGLAQWHLGRWTQYLTYAKGKGLDPMAASTQSDYLVQDLQAYNNGSLWERLRHAPNVTTATADVMKTYERPQDTSPAAVKRRVGTLLDVAVLQPSAAQQAQNYGGQLASSAKSGQLASSAKSGLAGLLDWQSFAWKAIAVVGGVGLILIGGAKVASPAINRGVELAGKAL